MDKGAETLNAEIDEEPRALDRLGLNDVYYLPGRQLNRAEEALGSITDDFTIVVELA